MIQAFRALSQFVWNDRSAYVFVLGVASFYLSVVLALFFPDRWLLAIGAFFASIFLFFTSALMGKL